MKYEQKNNRDKHHQEMEALRKEFEGRVKELLSEDQTDEFRKNHRHCPYDPKKGSKSYKKGIKK